MRRTVLALALLLCLPTVARASAISITWVGTSMIWYNYDIFPGCELPGAGGHCLYWDTFRSYGISVAQPSSTPLYLTLTIADALPDAYGVYQTTANVHIEFGSLGRTSYNQPMQLGPFGFLGASGFGLITSYVPNVFSYSGQRAVNIYVLGMGFTGSGNTLLSALLAQQSLASLSPSFNCISFGSDCDVAGVLTATKFSVPETSSFLSALAIGFTAAIVFGTRRLREIVVKLLAAHGRRALTR